MEIAFDAIGLDIPNDAAFDNLAESVQRRGEVSQMISQGGVLHGRCWRIGDGLEVWTLLYQSSSGEVFHADCRPGFRARFSRQISPWIMTELAEAGEAMVHGFIENTEIELIFELQNITEVSGRIFEQNTLSVGLCGLAFNAEIVRQGSPKRWESNNQQENVWNLCGRLLSFKALRNPVSGRDLYWLHLDLGNFELEILVNQKTLRGNDLQLGAMIRADVWLQGHIRSDSTALFRYEGVDYTHRTVDFWKKFKRLN